MKELETVASTTGAKKNRTAILSVSERGAKLGQRIKSLVAPPHADCFEKENRPSGGEAIYFDSLKNHIGQVFKDYDQVLCIMALGIVVRMIAPYIEHKSKDPAVVVMDEVGHHVISLLSGHLGGANEWTQSISLAIDADPPVITTATDVNGLPAPDVLARHEHLLVDDFQTLINVNSAIVGGERVDYYIDASLPNAEHLEQAAKAHIGEHGMVHVVSLEELASIPCKNESTEEGSSRVVITDKVIAEYGHQLILRPRTYTMGIGCRRDTPKELILDAIQQSLATHKLSPKSLVTAASVIVKQDEVGLLEAMQIMGGWPIVFYTQDEMAPLIEKEELKESNFVKGTIGVGNVCETTALLAAKSRTLIQHKTIYPKTTVAIAQVTSK
ncbi:cobalt-precorrin 5A hydrolase [Veillonella rogosae]|uniref:cobalt-precorrin 5A hydrolase n=1 Tax=Veillonella rogosae TaxID=423477 RepID=UPI0006CF8F86|nr:cobalamin biosynthesis protein [Veillonella rogosae]